MKKLLPLLLLVGCSSTPMTADEIFEQQYAAVERKESIREFIDVCEANKNVVIYTGPSTHRLRDPIRRIPNHAKRSDYQCTTTREVERMQAELGL